LRKLGPTSSHSAPQQGEHAGRPDIFFYNALDIGGAIVTAGASDARDKGGEAPCFAHLEEQISSSIDASALARLMRDLADAVVIADAGGAIVFWNPAATRIFGWSEGEALGQRLDLIIPERLRARHWTGYERVMETGHTDYGNRLLEVPALHRDGRTISIAFTVTLLTEPGGDRPTAIAAVLRDDTARRQELRSLADQLAAAKTSSHN
jgi:PAS domain S-box-containing protein